MGGARNVVKKGEKVTKNGRCHLGVSCLGATMICSLQLTASVSCSRSFIMNSGHKIFQEHYQSNQMWQFINSNLHQSVEDE